MNSRLCYNAVPTESIDDVIQHLSAEGCALLSDDSSYTGPMSPLKITCKNCGNPFYTSFFKFKYANSHYCRCCDGHLTGHRRMTQAEFEERLKEKQGDSIIVLGKYQGMGYHLRCKCSGCGKEWNPIAGNLVHNMTGCPFCAGSKGEQAIRTVLDHKQIRYSEQYKIRNCSHKRILSFDFAVHLNTGSNVSLLIEFDGVQHFQPVEGWGGQERFRCQQRNDHIKDSYCRDHGIPLLRISYKQFDQIEQLVTDKLYELNILQKEAA